MQRYWGAPLYKLDNLPLYGALKLFVIDGKQCYKAGMA
jgi:hypothetical protein